MRLIVLFALFSSSMAAEAEPPDRGVRLGVTYQDLVSNPFFENTSVGTGFTAVYEFILKENFVLGIQLAYRINFGEKEVTQLGYGLLMKHYLLDADFGIRPFLEYGLLLQNTRRKGATGSGTSHDTRLTVGSDVSTLGTILFLDFSYHISQLGFFDNQTLDLNYFESTVGVRLLW